MRLLFVSGGGYWLAEHNNNNAKVQWFDDGNQNNDARYGDHWVCAVRRLEI